MPDREFSDYEHWPTAILFVDDAGVIASANDRAEQLFSYAAIPERFRVAHSASS